jgi:hypothetical protein
MDIWGAWSAHRGRPVVKSDHFAEAYQRHLARFQGQPVTVLEIGIDRGGSLQLWKSYFGEQARIYGIDIDPACSEFAEDRIEILIGDQGDRAFLEHVAATLPTIDVLIDDGGHTMDQQRITFEVLYPKLSARGIYACEDAASSYWAKYGGSYRRPGTFIEDMKDRIDELNGWYGEAPGHEPTEFTRTTASLHFYSGLIIVEKAPVDPPRLMASNGRELSYPSAQYVLDAVRMPAAE